MVHIFCCDSKKKTAILADLIYQLITKYVSFNIHVESRQYQATDESDPTDSDCRGAPD